MQLHAALLPIMHQQALYTQSSMFVISRLGKMTSDFFSSSLKVPFFYFL